jgi:carboxyl-terminal processing protease
MAVCASIGAWYLIVAAFPFSSSAVDEQLKKDLDLFVSGMDVVQRNYYREVKENKLAYGALKGMCSALDPHSQFMDEEIYKDMKVETEGAFGGLGIEITIKDQFLTVVTPIEDTPAFKVGLLAGDRIIEIEGEATKDLSLVEAVRKLRGPVGTVVRITVMRAGTGELLPFSIKRAHIQIQSIKDVKIVKDGIGYVRLTQFQEHTGRDLEKALRELKKKGMRALILDLRNNPGGLLQVAIEIADKFIGGEKLLVYTKGRLKTQNIEFKAPGKAEFADYPLVILVNKGSASGSEIVAGAAQDWKRGIIVGGTTFGKGSVQSVLPLPDGSALRLTTAKYFTPKGRCIQKVGIDPDIVVEMTDEEEIKLIVKRRLEKMLKDNPKGEDMEAEREELEKLSSVIDAPMERAVDLLQGLLAYRSPTPAAGKP